MIAASVSRCARSESCYTSDLKGIAGLAPRLGILFIGMRHREESVLRIAGTAIISPVLIKRCEK